MSISFVLEDFRVIVLEDLEEADDVVASGLLLTLLDLVDEEPINKIV